MTPERLAECKKICACVPFIDNGVGVPETQAAMRELIDELTTATALLGECEVMINEVVVRFRLDQRQREPELCTLLTRIRAATQNGGVK